MNTVILTSAFMQKQSSSSTGFLIKRCSENSNFIEVTAWHGCSHVNLLHIFRIPFPNNTPGGLLLSIDGSLVDEFLAGVNASRDFPKKEVALVSDLFPDMFIPWNYNTNRNNM